MTRQGEKLRKVSLTSIERQIQNLQQRAEKLRQNEKGPALRKIVELMREHELAIADVRTALGGRKAGRKGPSKLRGRKVKPMYRNPKTGETWSGRGRVARWLAAFEKAGRKRAEFLIKKLP
jgi:DNA-binding protein H-NS